ECGVANAECGMSGPSQLEDRSSLSGSANSGVPHTAFRTPHSALPSGSPLRTPHSALRNPEVLDLLTSLVAKSLVSVDSAESGARYHMLETIRQYAADRLREADEEEAAHNAHLACFLGVAREIAPALREPELAEALNRVEAEMSNFRAALAWAATPGATP